MTPQTILLTCAGKSTRFPNHRSKWSLTHPNGNTMAAHALAGLHGKARIIVALNNDDSCFFGRDNVRAEFFASGHDVEVINVGDTQHQVETVRRAIQTAGIADDMPLTVRDCDNYFEWNVMPGNRVAIVDLNEVETPLVTKNKSYVMMDEDANDILELHEKRIVSPFFCCGAYSFARASYLQNGENATYLSTVVQACIDIGIHFLGAPAQHYEDWGTEEAWLNYTKEWRTLFVDIDGVLVHSSHRSFAPVWGQSQVIRENVDTLNAMHETGKVEIILTTSRPEALREETLRQLSGLHFDRLVMGLRHCQRVIVNDWVPRRSALTALAINIGRNEPALRELLATR